MIENVDHRVLGGFQCADAITRQSVVSPLKVGSLQLLLRPNLSGVYAVWDGPNLRSYTAFIPPSPWPNPSPFEVSIEDPSWFYLPRRATIQVPQPLPVTPPAPTLPFTGSSSQAIAYGPQPITLYRGPSAPIAANWAVVRASVTNSAIPPVGLPWSVLQILQSSGGATTVMATGMSDANGEALLAVPGLGLQVSSSAGGPVTETTTAATVQAWFDPGNLNQPPGWLPDPDLILNSLSSSAWKTASAPIQFGPGQTVIVPLTISV